ncbi:MAG: hypothetical protein AUG51_15620 [Acidobacteria bacterium 13_1_20CM_3_53_8]|nr:MAG: hypothetical protein AUG51_15620 [Acidobacteria bacterium 13_1_20CM_3_53_8]
MKKRRGDAETRRRGEKKRTDDAGIVSGFSSSLLLAASTCLRVSASLLLLLLLIAPFVAPLYGEQSRKLPSAERIVGDYLKAIGGRKRVASVRAAEYEWDVQFQGQPYGTAKTQVKAPSSLRTEMVFGNGEIVSAANTSSAWERGLDAMVRTLTGAEALAARLRADLDASHLIDFKKQNVMARTLSLDESTGEPAYIVEFSMRNGARLRYWFGQRSKLLMKIEDDARKTTTRFGDYRAEAVVVEPHRIELSVNGREALVLTLRRASYNANLSDAIFDPPRSNEALDVAAILRDLQKNQTEIDERIGQYSFRQKVTDREIGEHGEIKKETTSEYEVFPIPGHAPVFKLISENGVPLNSERAAREEHRVAEAMERAVRERDEELQRRERRRAERARRGNAASDDEQDELGISMFIRICEFVSPRRERFRDRDVIVFDFRPRPDFHPSNREEEIVSKLVGVVWIDPVDHQVIRLEAKLAQGIKIAGGLVASLRPGAAFVQEQTRLPDGLWMPRYAQVNLSLKVFLFSGADINKTFEWSDYRRYNADVSGYQLNSPNTNQNRPATNENMRPSGRP